MAKYKRGSLALARQVFNTPQLILAEDLQTIAQYLVNRANGVEAIASELDTVVEVKQEARSNLSEQEQRERTWRQLGITNDGKRGNLEVTGTLVAKAGQIDADCMELTSYEGLYSQFAKQVDEGIEELVLHVDSGGGSAFSCFEMAKEVKDLATANNIKIYAYVDQLSASAAYAWTSIADEIIARPDSEIGSVGVVVQLINNNKMLENIGITRKFITHGENKVPFGEDGEFTKQFISNLQKKVDKTGVEFTSFIAQNRNMDVKDVIATQAEVFDAQEALKVGFIDKIMTKSEFFNDYLPKQSANKSMYLLQTEETMSKQATLSADELQAELSTVQTQLKDAQELNTKLQADYATLLAEKATTDAQLKEFAEAKEALEAEKLATAKQAKLDARQAKLEDALGKDNEQVAQLLASTEVLDDTAFELLASTLLGSQESKQASYKEQGDEGQTSKTQLSLEQQFAETAKRLYGKQG